MFHGSGENVWLIYAGPDQHMVLFTIKGNVVLSTEEREREGRGRGREVKQEFPTARKI